MAIQLIEMVCTGNRGRSPVAELVARNYIRKIGAQNYQSISSGSSVDSIKRGELSTGFMISIIEGAKKRGDVYAPTEVADIDEAIKNGNGKAIASYYNKAVDLFGREEEQYRKEVLPQFGIEGVLKEVQEQTIARPDTVAVLSMAKRNNEQVKKIYEGSGFNPVIDVLSAYATGNPDAEIPNAFGKDREAYRAAIAGIVEDVPKAIDKLLA